MVQRFGPGIDTCKVKGDVGVAFDEHNSMSASS